MADNPAAVSIPTDPHIKSPQCYSRNKLVYCLVQKIVFVSIAPMTTLQSVNFHVSHSFQLYLGFRLHITKGVVTLCDSLLLAVCSESPMGVTKRIISGTAVFKPMGQVMPGIPVMLRLCQGGETLMHKCQGSKPRGEKTLLAHVHDDPFSFMGMCSLYLQCIYCVSPQKKKQ